MLGNFKLAKSAMSLRCGGGQLSHLFQHKNLVKYRFLLGFRVSQGRRERALKKEKKYIFVRNIERVTNDYVTQSTNLLANF